VAAGRATEGRALVEQARREIAGDPTATRLASEIDAWLATP
jgi:hypothetical protein